MTDEYTPIHFLDEHIDVTFHVPPAHEKSPTCPNEFTWSGKIYQVNESLSEWVDFSRSGKMAKNMHPAHAATAATKGSLNVGRFYFRVKVDSGQIFDIYYDRAMKEVDKRKGEWFVYRELEKR
ncbi:MAG: DUF6504 family protein [Anaerolineales bacterium]